MTKLKIFLTAAIGLFSFNSYALVQITDVKGASNYRTSDVLIPVIYGGASGPECSESSDTCDSCFGGVDMACNENRINDNGGEVSITIWSSDSGFVMVEDFFGNQVTAFNTFQVGAGRTATLSANWSDLCAEFGESYDCDATAFLELLKIGIDSDMDGRVDETALVSINVSSEVSSDSKDNTTVDRVSDYGIYSYEISPGYKTIRIDNIKAHGNFPQYGMAPLNFAKVRLFMERVNSMSACSDGITWDSITNRSDYVESDIRWFGPNGGYGLENYEFKGFESGETYAFKLALVDEAGNISWYLDGSQCNEDKHFATIY